MTAGTDNIGLDKTGYQSIFFLFLHENICCGYSVEVPHATNCAVWPGNIRLLM